MAETAAGSAARLALVREATYGVSPATGYFLMPAINWDLAEDQGFLEQDLIGQGRDSGRPERDVIEASGRCTVPLDLRAIGHYLTMFFGPPETTGTTPRVHVWTSGADSLPSFSIEEQFPDLTTPEFWMARGVMGNGFTLRQEARGRANLDLDLHASSKTRSTTSGAGTPSPIVIQRFNQNHSMITRNGTDLAKIVSATIPFMNNNELVRYVGGGGQIGDIVPGLVSAEGEIVARLHTGLGAGLVADALAESVFDLTMSYEITANQSIAFKIKQAEVGKPRVSIPGPGGVEVRFNWKGSSNGTTIQAMEVELRNDVAEYWA